jgi:uncharacterized protein (DUF4415 family)
MAIKFSEEDKRQAIKGLPTEPFKLPALTNDQKEAMLAGDFDAVLNSKKRAKVQLTVRLDDDIIKTLKATGEGWQTRLNALLRIALNL